MPYPNGYNSCLQVLTYLVYASDRMLPCFTPTEFEIIHTFDSRHGLVTDKSYETLILNAAIRLLIYSLIPCQLAPHH